MRKIFIILMSVFMVQLLAGCSSDDTVTTDGDTDNAIGFNSDMTATSRTNKDPLVSSMANVTDFQVMAYYTGAKAFTAIPTTGTPFMNNVTVAKNAKGIWKPSDHSYYWPSSTDKISFFAYSFTPSFGSSGSSRATWSDGSAEYDEKNHKIIYVNTQFYNSNVQSDLIYAKAIDKTATNSKGGVKLAFTHALTQLSFSAKLSQAITGLTVQVASITISNVYRKASLSLYDATAKDMKWDNYDTTMLMDYPFTTAAGMLKSTNLTTTSQSLLVTGTNGYTPLLIPQTFRNDSKITVTFTVTFPNHTETPQTITQSYLMSKVIKAITPGTKLNLDITFQATSIPSINGQIYLWGQSILSGYGADVPLN